MTATEMTSHRSARWPVLAAIALLLIEFTAVGTVFKHAIDFECLAHWPQPFCAGASKALVACYCLLGVTLLIRMLRPDAIRDLTQSAGERLWPLSLNILGVIISFGPLALLDGAEGASGLYPSITLWTIGMILMLTGVALFVAPLPRWRAFVAAEWTSLLPAAVLATITPWAAVLLRPIWSIGWIADQTFSAVTAVMSGIGYDMYSDPSEKIIGAKDFYVTVNKPCSGIEGIALVTLFVSLYLWLFRKELRFPLAFLLYPIGIAASVTFNVVRISALLVIGIEGNPDLAINGFHSHAGWLMFTVVSLGLIALAQLVPGLRKAETGPVSAQTALPPFWQDPAVAQILPFIVFMFSALIAQAFSQTPSVIYPLRVLAMVAVMALVVPFYLRLPWRVDPVAVAVGAFIAAYWILIPVEATEEATAPYGALTGGLLVLWFIARGFGTIVLIPVIEELFFRGYLESRLRLGSGLAWQIGAATVTAVLFALLHGRWLEAFVAGLLFSYVAVRRGNITDAIIAHAVANALIFGAAVATGNLAMI